MTTLTFRPYSPANYQDYIRIYQPYFLDTIKVNTDAQYVSQISQSGFLVGDPNTTDSTLMTNSPFHLCAYIDDKVVGIIRSDKLEISNDHDKLTNWLPNTSQSSHAFHNGAGLELGVIMVDQQYKHRGVAKDLLTQLLTWMNEQGYPYLFSWVVNNPPNTPSLSFHHKHGFVAVAEYQSPEAFGIKNYRSTLFLLQT